MQRIDRRGFMTRMLALGLLSPIAVSARAGAEPAAVVAGTDGEWATLAAILQHLLPGGDGAPSAADVHAIDYLRATLDEPLADRAWRARMLSGAARVQAAALAAHERAFVALDGEAREQVPRTIEGEPGGQTFLSKLLDFLIEGLLADPIYGGNADQRGWRWLQHSPGFPRPPADKAWYRLAGLRNPRHKGV